MIRMKLLPSRSGVILTIIRLITLGYVEVWGADWKVFFIATKGKCLYDAEGVSRPSRDMVRVWIKMGEEVKAIKSKL